MSVLTDFFGPFAALLSFATAVGVTCDKYIKPEFKRDIWNKLLSGHTTISQRDLRDLCKAYLQHTAFRVFSHPPISLRSFLTSAAITVFIIVLLYVLYCYVHAVAPYDILSRSHTLPLVLVFMGIIIVDYLSVVQTLYIMRYATTASHFLELVFLFIADVVLTANLFSFVFAVFIAIDIYLVLYTPHSVDISARTQSPQFAHELCRAIYRPDVAQQRGQTAGCAHIFVKKENAERYNAHFIPFVSRDDSVETFVAALFTGCIKTRESTPLAAVQTQDDGWRLSEPSKKNTDAIQTHEFTDYKCRKAPGDMLRSPELISPMFAYQIGYEVGTWGQRAFLGLIMLHRVEWDLRKGLFMVFNAAIPLPKDPPDLPIVTGGLWVLLDRGEGTAGINTEQATNRLCEGCVIAAYMPWLEVAFDGASTVVIPLSVAFLSSLYLTVLFYFLMFVFIGFGVIMGRLLRIVPLVDRVTTLADFPFTLVFSFGGSVMGGVIGILAISMTD